MDARSLRLYASVAAVPAVVVIVAHLAWEWHLHPASTDRRAQAFDHGVALAVVLAAVLGAARVALRLGGPRIAIVTDVVVTALSIAVMAHLAADWRDHGVGDVGVLAAHLGALAAIAAGGILAHRRARMPPAST